MAEQLLIEAKATAAESAWSKGVAERHNSVIADLLDKILADTSINYDIPVDWFINAKNSLQNINGFFSYQLAIVGNLQLSSVLSDDLLSHKK